MYLGRKVLSEKKQECVNIHPIGKQSLELETACAGSSVTTIKISPSVCPECGGPMVRMEGCFCCVVCGWGACG